MFKLEKVQAKNGIPVLRTADLEAIAEDVIKTFTGKSFLTPEAIDIEQFAESYLKIRVDYADLSHNQSILGMMIFHDCNVPFYIPTEKTVKHYRVKSGTALIDRSLIDENKLQARARFTIAHECAHWILHQPQAGKKFDGLICRKVSSYSAEEKSMTAYQWREWQADNMASALLMPAASVKHYLTAYLEQQSKRESDFLDCFGERMVLARTQSLIKQLASVFNVSEKAAEIRLKKLGYITDPLPEEKSITIENPYELAFDWF